MKSFSRLALATASATFLLIVVGGVVRATGAGLACPDWPLCRGRLIPPLEPLVLIEYGHRLAASGVGLLTVALVISAVRRFSLRSEIARLAGFALVLLAAQIGLGALTVRHQLSAWIVVAHLGTAMAFFATVVTIAVMSMLGSEARSTGHEARRDGFWKLAAVTLAATYALVLIGGYVSASGAGLACPDWPLCYGQVLPSLRGSVAVQFSHRVAAGLVSLLIVATAAAAYRTQARRPQLLAASAIAVGLLALQVILGALNVEYALADSVTIAHLATAAALFATLVVLLILARRVPESAAEAAAARADRPSRMARVLDYVALTKPRIMILLLVTAVAAMLIAAPGRVSPWLILATLVGGALASGSASAINQLLERDIDAMMARTRRRPVAAGRVQPPFAFAFATLLGFVAFAVLAVFVNLLSAVLAIGGLLFYVFVYTVWLKRITPQNIVIGGAAGAVPPLVGWAAATGRIELPAIILFLIVFLWTPPHFWALSLYRREDYARAGVPMLPVVAGEEATRRQIVVYSVALAAVSLLLYPFGGLGVFYTAAAGISGVLFIALAVRVLRQKTPKAAVRLFGYSILYLGILFGAMVLDRFLS